MSPLKLHMILDFYALAEVDVNKSEMHKDSTLWLYENKMIDIDSNGDYKATKKLEFFVKEILKTKLPEVTYVIPK